LTIAIDVTSNICISDDFFDIRLHECSSESQCRRINLGMSWFQFWTISSTNSVFYKAYNFSLWTYSI
jgi:hypothetical protein